MLKVRNFFKNQLFWAEICSIKSGFRNAGPKIVNIDHCALAALQYVVFFFWQLAIFR